MNRNIIFGVISLIVLAVAIAAGVLLTRDSSESNSSDSSETNQMATAQASDTQENVNMPNEANSVGLYTDYSENLLSNATNGNVVLFFHADWCPTCLALERDIERNLENIPSDLTILKTPYGNSGETDLAKRYNVSIQHTLIQVDKDGNEIARWAGSPRLSDVVSEVI